MTVPADVSTPNGAMQAAMHIAQKEVGHLFFKILLVI